MEAQGVREIAQGMVERFGDQAGAEAFALAAEASVIGDFSSLLLWLEVRNWIRALSAGEPAGS